MPSPNPSQTSFPVKAQFCQYSCLYMKDSSSIAMSVWDHHIILLTNIAIPAEANFTFLQLRVRMDCALLVQRSGVIGKTTHFLLKVVSNWFIKNNKHDSPFSLMKLHLFRFGFKTKESGSLY